MVRWTVCKLLGGRKSELRELAAHFFADKRLWLGWRDVLGALAFCHQCACAVDRFLERMTRRQCIAQQRLAEVGELSIVAATE